MISSVLKSFLQLGQQWLCFVSQPRTHGAWKECPHVSSQTIVLMFCSFDSSISIKQIEHV